MQQKKESNYRRAGWSDVDEACRLADDWLVAQCPEDIARPFDFEDLEDRNLRLKALSEISLLSTLADGRPDTGLLALARRWMADHGLRQKALSAVRHAPQRAHLIMPFFIAQIQTGQFSQAQTNDIHSLLDLFETRLLNELVPYRALDFWYLAWTLSRQDSQFERFLPLASVGCLATDTSAWNIDDRRAYAITHTIFYLTDFGKRPWPAQLCSLSFLNDLLDALSLKAQIESNCDLLAEYLLCRRCLKVSTGRMAQEIEFLLAAQHPTGLWPAPVEEQRLDRHINPKKFFEHYHTTLMARFALSGLNADLPQATLAPAVPREMIARLTVGSDFFGTPGFAEIYASYQELIQASERRGDGKSSLASRDILLDGVAQQRSCVHVVTYMYWLSRKGILNDDFRDLVRPVLDLPANTVSQNVGLFRIWSLVHAICADVPRSDADLLLDDFARRLQHPSWFLADIQDRLDILAGMLILRSALGTKRHGAALATAAVDELVYAMSSGGIVTLVTLLPYIDDLQIEDGILNEATAYFASMLPESQCFGWLGDGGYGDNRTVAEDLQLQAIQVFLPDRMRMRLDRRQ